MNSSQPAKRRWPDYLALAVIAAAVAWQVLVPPAIGMADNGDFPRIMSRFDIGYTSEKYEDRYFAFFNSKYRVDKNGHWDSGFVSSQTLLMALAQPVNKLLSKPGFFDIRSVAVVHLALELIAAWLLLFYAPVEGGFARAVLLSLVIVVLTDAAYVSYFNSFYSEPGTFVFLLLTLGAIFMTIRRPTAGAIFLLSVAGLLFITSKPQNAAPGMILAFYATRLCALRAGTAWRRACAGVAASLVAGSVACFMLKPAEIITKPSYYLSVFYEILRFSPDPRRDLTELGLDPNLEKYAGTIPFPMESPIHDPEFQRAFFDKMGFVKVIRFHLNHPTRFLGGLQRSAEYAPLLRPALGNFEKSDGRAPFALSEAFDLWSRAHKAYSPGSVAGFAGFFLLNYAGIALLYRKKRAQPYRLLLELQAILLLIAAMQFASVVIAQGTFEPVKHLFLFNLTMHICFGIDVVWVAAQAQRAIRRTRLLSALPARPAWLRNTFRPRQAFQPGKPGWKGYVVIALIVAASVWQLLLPPLIGLADQGDFPRIMSPFDIGYITDKYQDRFFAYFNSKYGIDKKNHWDGGFVSSQTLLVGAALKINGLFSKPGLFDIRSLSVILIALEAWAAWLLLAYAPVTGKIPREALLGVVFLALSDVGYISFFNSFFSESGSFVFLLLALGAVMMVMARPSFGALLGVFAASLLFITSKPQNVPSGMILAIFVLRLFTLRADKAWRWSCAGTTLGLLSTAMYYYTLTPKDVTVKPAQYLSVFAEILPNSPAPRQDLVDLGLDPGLAKYTWTSPWSPDSPTGNPDFRKAFFDKIGFSSLIRFYLRHPIRLLEHLDRCARYAPELRPWVGNYEKSEGRHPWAKSRSFNLWSTLREKYSPGSLKSFGLYFGLNYVVMAFLYRRTASHEKRLMIELQAILLLMAAVQFATVALGVGTHEATKHLFLFDLLVDVSFAVGLLWLTSLAVERTLPESEDGAV